MKLKSGLQISKRLLQVPVMYEFHCT